MSVLNIIILLSATFVAGMIAVALRLPALVGFLTAGFVLYGLGFSEPSQLGPIADVGVTLLLFTIGLKFDLRIITRREVWGTGALHMAISTLLGAGVLGLVLLLVGGSVPSFGVLMILGFACSFSSTVLCVKLLEEHSDDTTLYGQVAIGILLIQDVAAVVFMTVSKGKPPSLWALALVLLVPLVGVARRVLERLQRGEMVVLFGLAMALVPGWWAFEVVGLKGDLGALIVGLMLGRSTKSEELSKALFSIKELLLVAFFLTIGFNGLPSLRDIVVAVLAVVVLVPAKTWGYAWLLARFGLRTRTAAKASLTLSNLSEFGIIVAAVGHNSGWLEETWVVTIALAVALSMATSTALNNREANVSRRMESGLPGLPPERIVPHDRPIDLAAADSLVLGMGRIGRAAYDRLVDEGHRVWGIENDEARVRWLRARGYHVLEEDATDGEFWRRVHSEGQVELVLLAMPHHEANLFALEQLEASEFEGASAAVVRYTDEAEELRDRGVGSVLNLYEGAGLVLAEDGLEQLQP